MNRLRFSALVLVVFSFALFTLGHPADGARVCRQRVYESEKTIVNILERLAVGAALNQATTEEVIEQLKKLEAERHLELADLHFDLDSVELRIDEQPGPLTIERLREAYQRIEGYIENNDARGSVELRYEFRVRHLRIRRSTYVAEGRLRFHTQIYGQMGRLSSISLTLDGQEHADGTRIVLSSTACAPIGHFRWGPITQYAERLMAEGVDEKLWQLERKAKQIIDSAEPRLLDLTREFILDVRYGLQ